MKFNIVKKTVDSVKDVLFVENSYLFEDLYPENIKKTDDNVRVYVPMDISQDSVIARLRNVIYKYGEANEANEMSFSVDVEQVLFQLDIYDEYWLEHENPSNEEHSRHGTELAKKVIQVLEDIPDGCAECFPFETIDQLKHEYNL